MLCGQARCADKQAVRALPVGVRLLWVLGWVAQIAVVAGRDSATAIC